MSCQFKGGWNGKECGMSWRNSVHKDKRQFGYHEYVTPPPEEYEPTVEDRLAALERRVKDLEEKQ